MLGKDARGLSKSSVASLKKQWLAELDAWLQQPIEDEFVYLWADGVNVNVRLSEDRNVRLKICFLDRALSFLYSSAHWLGIVVIP